MNAAQQFLIDQCILEFNAYVQSLDGKHVGMQTTKNTNWVCDEMMAYMQQRSPSHVSQTSLIDVLEIYCSADSQLTKQCIRQGFEDSTFWSSSRRSFNI